MDLRRLRFGDWIMGIGAVAVLGVMFLDWFEAPEGAYCNRAAGECVTVGEIGFNAWESFAVNDAILALAALMALTAIVFTALHPTAAVPLAVASLTTLVAIIALVLVALRLIWPPDVGTGDTVETARLIGSWLGLVAASILAGGALASIRDERLPRPEHHVEPRLVNL